MPHRAREVAGERIVAARVEQDDAGLGLALHFLEHQREGHAFEVGVAFAAKSRVDRHQIVLPADLQAMAGVEEKGQVGSGQLDAELPDEAFHGALVEVAPLEHLEAEAPQRSRNID